MTIKEIEEFISQMDLSDMTQLELEIPHLITEVKAFGARLRTLQQEKDALQKDLEKCNDEYMQVLWGGAL